MRTTEVQRSKWTPDFLAYGIDQDTFNINHLYRLSGDDLSRVASIVWASGFVDGDKAVSVTCGPQVRSVDRAIAKVRLEMPSDTNSEVASGIRTNLRAKPDVRLVYSEDEADVTVDILVISNTSAVNSSYVLGYTATLLATRNCIIGNYKSTLVIGHEVQTAGSQQALISAVVADIDSNVLELVRQWNANATKGANSSK